MFALADRAKAYGTGPEKMTGTPVGRRTRDDQLTIWDCNTSTARRNGSELTAAAQCRPDEYSQYAKGE